MAPIKMGPGDDLLWWSIGFGAESVSSRLGSPFEELDFIVVDEELGCESNDPNEHMGMLSWVEDEPE